MKPVQVFLPPKILEEVKNKVKEFGTSFSEFLRAIIIAGGQIWPLPSFWGGNPKH